MCVPQPPGGTFQGVECERNIICPIIQKHQKGSYMVWGINMGVCPHLEFYNIMFINCLGMTFIFMVHLSFYAIPLLIYDVMYNMTTIP